MPAGDAGHVAEVHEDLRDLYTADGPFVTACLAAPSAVEDAAHRWDVSIRHVCSELEESGAPASQVGRVDRLLRDVGHDAGDQVLVVADSEGVRAAAFGLPDGTVEPFTRRDELPDLVPVLRWRQEMVPHLVVLTDRVGADVFAVGPGREDIHEEHVDGETLHIHRGHPGGWSQRRFQQRAENTWEDNARAVADLIERLDREVVPAVVVVAGDVRASAFMAKHLPDSTAAKLVEVPGGRHEGTDDEAVWTEVRAVVSVAAERATAEVLDRFRAEVGQHDRAAESRDAVLAALSAGQVEVLIVHHDAHDERRAWFGRDKPVASAESDSLAATGAEPHEGRLVDVAVRGALMTGADICVAPAGGGPTDGLGAVLRWA